MPEFWLIRVQGENTVQRSGGASSSLPSPLRSRGMARLGYPSLRCRRDGRSFTHFYSRCAREGERHQKDRPLSLSRAAWKGPSFPCWSTPRGDSRSCLPGWLRYFPKVRKDSAATDAELCFKCKVGDHHEGMTCAERQAERWILRPSSARLETSRRCGPRDAITSHAKVCGNSSELGDLRAIQ